MSIRASSNPQRYEAALAWFRSRVQIADFDELEKAVGGLAFRVAGATQLHVVIAVWEALERALEDGTDFEDFKADVADVLEESWGGKIPGRLETIFRTNLQNAYGAGRYSEQYTDEAVATRPYVRLDVTLDSRTSEICEAIKDVGAVPKDGAWIARHHPPLHFDCRTNEVDLSEEEAQELGITKRPPRAPAGDGFGGVPSFDWEQNLDEVPKPLREIARAKTR